MTTLIAAHNKARPFALFSPGASELDLAGPPPSSAPSRRSRGPRFLPAFWPALAERWAAHLFLTPRRSARPDWEDEVLATALPSPYRVQGNAVWRWGSGPLVFLVHGWEGRGGQLGAFVEPLVSAGYSVLTFDAPAHGVSPGFESTAADTARVLLELQARFGAPEAVIAHSLGSVATLIAVRKGLRAKAVTLVAPPSPSAAVARFARAVGIDGALFDAVKRRIEDKVGLSFAEVEPAALVAGLRTAGLVVHDRGDREVPFHAGEAVAESWDGAQLVATEGLGHRRILRDPYVVRRVTDFVVARTRSAARTAA